MNQRGSESLESFNLGSEVAEHAQVEVLTVLGSLGFSHALEPQGRASPTSERTGVRFCGAAEAHTGIEHNSTPRTTERTAGALIQFHRSGPAESQQKAL